MTYFRPRCGAKNRRDGRCGCWALPNERFCVYHVGDHRTAAAHERNRQGTRRYWERFRVAKALATSASAAPERRNYTDDQA